MKQTFWKTKTFFRKLEYNFLVESSEIENVSFPYKTAISEANVTTKYNGDYKMDQTLSGPVKKNRVLPVTTLFV